MFFMGFARNIGQDGLDKSNNLRRTSFNKFDLYSRLARGPWVYYVFISSFVVTTFQLPGQHQS